MTTPAISLSNVALQSAQGYSVYHKCDGTNNPPVNGAIRTLLRRSESRPASVNHPKNRGGWRSPGAWNHSIITDNPYLGIFREWSSSCSYTTWYNGDIWTSTGTSLPAFPSYLAGRAVSRALLRLKNSGVNLAVAFAERKQTIDLFKHSARVIASQVRNYKRHDLKRWGQVVRGNWKNSPNSWLELQYGWKPLVSDIVGACNALSKLQNGNNPYLARVKGFSSSKDINRWRKVTNRSPLYGFDVTDTWEHACKVVLYYELRNPVLAAFSSLGLTNPFELAWEKAKYSFILDWILPVGNWLSTLDADFGWDFHSGTRTEFSRGGSKSVYRNTGLVPGTYKAEYYGAPYYATGMKMNRYVYDSSPWAGLPSFKNPLSGLHVANALALLVQAFRR